MRIIPSAEIPASDQSVQFPKYAAGGILGKDFQPDVEPDIDRVDQLDFLQAGKNETDSNCRSNLRNSASNPPNIDLENRGLSPHLALTSFTPSPGGVNRPKSAKSAEWQQAMILERWALKETIVVKLGTAGYREEAAELDGCNTKKSVAVCNGCQKPTVFFNRCDKRHCPCCAHRLARERQESIQWWAESIKQGKHVVLTVRNSDLLTSERIRWLKSRLARLRRQKVCANWRGGCWSLEVTNEARGWHLHFHLLVDADWIDKPALDEAWRKLLGQDVVITHVKDARDQDYVREVAKYLVKPSVMAAWSGQQIGIFIRAFAKNRTFGVFGTLHKARSEWKAFKDAHINVTPACECGCSSFRVFSENEYNWRELTSGNAPNRPAVRVSSGLEPELMLL